ncbi:MAG: ribosome maturation factor RimM [Ignavibacteriales bacterium]
MHYFLIARAEQLYGKNGAISLRSFLDSVERYSGLKKVYLDFWGEKKIFYIEDVKEVKRRVVIKLRNFDTTRESEVLLNREIFIDEEDAKTFPADHINLNDLIGSEVFVEGKLIGVIMELMNTNANDVLVIKGIEKKEILVPFVLSFIEKFNAGEKKLILNVSKEFLEDNED